ncbi:hypothetical protein BGP_1196 [Beggiatoa sp. PS]|nr:hypothetical protein BGP_1196 [Beggiatoa sp. PS]
MRRNPIIEVESVTVAPNVSSKSMAILGFIIISQVNNFLPNSKCVKGFQKDYQKKLFLPNTMQHYGDFLIPTQSVGTRTNIILGVIKSDSCRVGFA